MENLLGKKFGQLEVIKFIEKSGRTTKWLCKCSCGKEQILKYGTIHKRKSCGCAQKNVFKDLSGKKYHKLTLLRCIGQNNYKSFIYEAKCDCGKVIQCEGNDVKTSRLKSCGCIKQDIAKEKANYKQSLFNNLYADYRIKAEQRSLVFKIDKKNFLEISQKNCHYCNVKPSNTKKHKSLNVVECITYNGLDRLDNSKGYTLNNVVPCCSICNQAKHQLTLDKYIDWINLILEAKRSKIGFWEN